MDRDKGGDMDGDMDRDKGGDVDRGAATRDRGARPAWTERGRATAYTRLAPSVDGDWLEDFVVEQRLLGVSGDRIGDALALIESHVVESGEPVRDAFGDPRGYAREAAPAARPGAEGDPAWLLGVGLGLAGMLLTSLGAIEWLVGTGTLEVTAGLLVTAGLALAAFAVLAVAPETLLGLAVRRTGAFVGACVLVAVLMVVANLVLPAVVDRWPAGVVVIGGLVVLVAGTVLQWRTARRCGLDDPIVGPGRSAPAPQRTGRGLDWAAVALFPVLTLSMVGLGWAIDLLG